MQSIYNLCFCEPDSRQDSTALSSTIHSHDQATHIYLLAVDSSKYQPVAKLLDAIELLCMIFYLLLNERGGEGDVTCRDEGTHIFAY